MVPGVWRHSIGGQIGLTRRVAVALDLPQHVTTQMEAKQFTVTTISKLVFDLLARDGSIARDTDVASSITGVDSTWHHHRQPAVLEALVDTRPKRHVPQLRFDGHGAYRAGGLLNLC